MDTSVLSLVMSAAALLFSIISPIATAWFNHRSRMKEKAIDIQEKRLQDSNDFYLNRKLKAIEKFLHSASSAIENKNNALLSETIGEIYLYTDVSYWNVITDIINKINDLEYEAAVEPLAKLAQNLHDFEISHLNAANND